MPKRKSAQRTVTSLVQPRLECTTWDKVRKQVTKINPQLATHIDNLNPGKELTLYLVSYPYGYPIEFDQFHYPTNRGNAVPLTDMTLPKSVRDDFAYAGTATPAGVVLHNVMELFIDAKEHIIPRKIFRPGDIFALWGHLDTSQTFHPSPLQQLIAGARSIFMIPNISDSTRHLRLKTYFNVQSLPPKDLRDQSDVFTSILNHHYAKCDWSVQLLLFSGNWIKRLQQEDLRYQQLYTFLLKYAWKDSAYWRNKMYYDFIFSAIQRKRNLRPDPYLLDTVKHLLTIAAGAIPGFGVAVTNEAAPIDLLQKIYVNYYGLKYTPTILHPTYFNWEKTGEKPVYYSFQYPTSIEFSPRSREPTNTLYELSQTKHILNVVIHEINQRKLKIEHGIIAKITNSTQFDFFHSKVDRHGDIQPTKTMPIEDPRLIQSKAPDVSSEFAATGTFVRGCVRLSQKDGIV